MKNLAEFQLIGRVGRITPLDGGGGPAGLSTDFHLGVVGASNGGGGSGGITGVSWQ